MKKEEQTNASVEFAIVIMIVLVIALFRKTQEVGSEYITHTFFSVFLVLIAFILAIFLIYLLFKLSKRSKIRKDRFIDEINKMNKDYNSLHEVFVTEKRLNRFIKENKRLANKLNSTIIHIKKKLHTDKRKIKEQEEKKKKELELHKQEKQEERGLILKVVRYFQQKNSAEAIPEWAVQYNSEIIDNAVHKYTKIEEEKAKNERRWQEVVRFVLKNKAYPLNFNMKNYREQQMFRKALLLSKQGRLEKELKEEIKAIDDEDKELISRRFYSADELKPEEREKLITKYGYKRKPFIFRDGSSGNNLIIKNEGKSESDYHFCMKYLIAEVDEANTKAEYAIGDLRADVAFIYTHGKIAVEIETGSNKEEQVKKKVNWLNKHFDYWIFLCSRKNKKYYRKYVDNMKSFCLTIKESDDKLQQLILNY